MRRRAFSIIELITTLTIIAVITAVLLPTLRFAKEHSKLLICSSNLRHNYIFLFSYANDFQGFLPKTDSPFHTNQFTNISGPSINGPLYYLWRSKYINQPGTWYCPSGKDNFDKNWRITNGLLVPVESAFCGYQYRMYFAFNWPDIKNSTAKYRQNPELVGYLKPSQHRNLALFADAITYIKPQSFSNHNLIHRSNVMFSDSSVSSRNDGGAIRKMDLSWKQAGDWLVPLSNGQPDTIHNAALLWRFFDKGRW